MRFSKDRHAQQYMSASSRMDDHHGVHNAQSAKQTIFRIQKKIGIVYRSIDSIIENRNDVLYQPIENNLGS